MNGEEPPELGRDDPSNGGGQLDEGRRYWKAAIAHLAPEKREAAWDFYLDRLESSPAADTLGGVMLLLEAHLAFFDDLPARLVAAARQMEAALSPVGSSATAVATSPPAIKPVGTNARPVSSKRKLPPWAIAVLSGVLGAVLASVGVLSFQRFRVDLAVPRRSGVQDVLFSRTHTISVEPWDDAAIRRQRGCVVRFDHAAWTEQTMAGGAKVYVFSPVEEVRHDLESLRQLAPSPAPKVP